MKTFLRKFGEFMWQQIAFGALLAGLILWQQIERGIVSVAAVRDNFLAVAQPYGWVVGAILLWHLARTAYLIYLEDQEEIDRLRKDTVSQNSFKEETHKLAESIMDFIHGRIENTPTWPVKAFTFSDSPMQSIMEQSSRIAISKNYESETLEIYEYRFARKVVATVKTFDNMNLRLDTPNGFWSAPADSSSIKLIGKTLAELADRIPEPQKLTAAIGG